MSGLTFAKFPKKRNIPVFLDNGCTVSFMQKRYLISMIFYTNINNIQSSDYMVMHTGNGDIKSSLLDSVPAKN